MKQVKIEGNNIIPGRLHITERTIISIWGHKYTREEFDRMIEQHKPPTFDEVVKAWEDAYENQPGLEFNTEQPLRIEVHYRIHPTNWMTKRLAVVDLRSDYVEQGNTSIAYHQAINLTIRYLESQKDKENE